MLDTRRYCEVGLTVFLPTPQFLEVAEDCCMLSALRRTVSFLHIHPTSDYVMSINFLES